ncbi:MAG: ATP-binding protein [Lentimicrobium sp.]|nr:ATP-binding protein [Lentimicrobium sp.]
MIERSIQQLLHNLSATYPVVTITGPRQAGKTTLAKMTFPGYNYCNLEHPEIRILAQQDPKSFMLQYPAPVIIDEIQRVPELLSYIQVDVDSKKRNGDYILTGSQQFNLHASVSQSLAGRTALLALLPFSLQELSFYEKSGINRDKVLFKGFLPRIYDQNQEPVMAYRNYLQTYIERDIRQLINIKDIHVFETFLKLLAGRVGQLVNYNSLASDTGVSAVTIANWLSALEASFIVFRLNPYFENLGKRVIKSPKIYFTEPGLACYLLGIEDVTQVGRDPLLGNLFENMVVMEAVKARYNKGLDANLYFFRDSNHYEIDLLWKKDGSLFPVEIKSALTWNESFTKNINRFKKGISTKNKGCVVYGGELNFTTRDDVMVTGFDQFYKLI